MTPSSVARRPAFRIRKGSERSKLQAKRQVPAAAANRIDRPHFRINRKGTYLHVTHRLGNALNTILALLPLLKDQDIAVEIPDDGSKPAWIKMAPKPPPDEPPQLDLGT